MEVDETMFPGQVHHPRFIGERFGRILNRLSRSDFGSLSLVGCATTVSWCKGAPVPAVPLKLLFKLGVGAIRQSMQSIQPPRR